MAIGLPSLSKDGWTDNRDTILEKLYLYWLAADIQDSNLFSSNISSLKYVLSKTDNIDSSISYIKDSLSTLYDKFFDTLTIDVFKNEEGGLVYLGINIIGYYKDKKYTLDKALLVNRENKIDIYRTLLNYSLFRNE